MPGGGSPTDRDLVILGGGMAGLTLAIQLKGKRPDARVLVVEKLRHPVQEKAFKIGESLAEIGSYYLRDVVGVADHLQTEQLPKFGLRFLMTAGDNRDISRRIECGPLQWDGSDVPLPFKGLGLNTHNVDRGRLENHLWKTAEALGVELLDRTRIESFDLGDKHHHIEMSQDGKRTSLSCRWLVDASGRGGRLKRKLGLAATTEHRADAVWFRVDAGLELDAWSSIETWRRRTQQGLRHFSTSHLVGPGYWIWIIPLPDGATSVGIMTDPDRHPRSEMRPIGKTSSWLRLHEPQLAEFLGDHETELLDFRSMHAGAYGCRQLFSADGWAISGDAGAFLDPLYSPGIDHIAVANTLATRLISLDLAGEDVTQEAANADALFQGLFRRGLTLYEKQYEILANPRVMSAKVVWDHAVYFGVTAFLFLADRFCEFRFQNDNRFQIARADELNFRTQALLLDWSRHERRDYEGGFVDIGSLPFVMELYKANWRSYDRETMAQRLSQNVLILERMAKAYACQAGRAEGRSRPPESPRNWRELHLDSEPA